MANTSFFMFFLSANQNVLSGPPLRLSKPQVTALLLQSAVAGQSLDRKVLCRLSFDRVQHARLSTSIPICLTSVRGEPFDFACRTMKSFRQSIAQDEDLLAHSDFG